MQTRFFSVVRPQQGGVAWAVGKERYGGVHFAVVAQGRLRFASLIIVEGADACFNEVFYFVAPIGEVVVVVVNEFLLQCIEFLGRHVGVAFELCCLAQQVEGRFRATRVRKFVLAQEVDEVGIFSIAQAERVGGSNGGMLLPVAGAVVEKLKAKENVEFILDSEVTALLGDDELTGIEVTNKKTGEKKELEISGLFIAIGQMPDNTAFASVVDLDEKGYIIGKEDCLTNTPGVFTAGDCRTKAVRQLTTAAADGAVAALAAAAYCG